MSLANDDPDLRDTAVMLRERAARARRLVMAPTQETDRRVLLNYAEDLEVRADEMERGGMISNA
jgi:hypothetical protein